jgi:adenosine deaminase
MESEYLELINTFQLSKEDIKLLQINAVKSIWADAKTKMQLNDDILSYFNSQDFS